MPNANLVNPLTGETISECAMRFVRFEIQHWPSRANVSQGEMFAQAQLRAESLAKSTMAQNDTRLQDFYLAVAAHLSQG